MITKSFEHGTVIELEERHVQNIIEHGNESSTIANIRNHLKGSCASVIYIPAKHLRDMGSQYVTRIEPLFQFMNNRTILRKTYGD